MFCVVSCGLCSDIDRLRYYRGRGRGGVIMLENCVPWLDVIGYVWFSGSSEWLQVVCGRVLCGESM